MGAGRQARGSEGRSRVGGGSLAGNGWRAGDARLRGRHTPTRVDPCQPGRPVAARPTGRGGELGRVGVEGSVHGNQGGPASPRSPAFRAPGRRPLPSGLAGLVLAVLAPARRGPRRPAAAKGAEGEGPRQTTAGRAG